MSNQGQERHPVSRPPRRRRVALALAAAVVALYLLLPTFSTSAWLRSHVQQAVAAASGKQVHIERLAIGYDLSVRLSGFSLSEPDTAPFVMADHVTARLSPAGLFSGQPIAIQLERPRLFTAHLPPAGDGSGPTALPFRSIGIEDGYLVTAAEEIGPITVSVDTAGAAEDATLSVELDPRLPPLNVTAAVVTTEGPLRLADIRLSWQRVPMAILAERFAVLPAGASVEGTLDIAGTAAGGLDSLGGSGSFTIEGLRYQSDAFGIAGDVTAPFVLQGTTVDFKDPGIRFSEPTFAFAGVTGTAAQTTLVGTLARDGGGVRGSGRLALTGVAAHDPEFERVIEKLVIDGKLEVIWNAGTAPALLVDLSIPGGELLWDRFYADLSRHPLKLAGEIRSAATSIEVVKIDARAAGIGTVKGEARLRSATVERFAGRVEATNLDNLYALAIRDPYQESFPFLSTSAVGGKLSARVDYTADANSFALSGHLRVDSASATVAEPAVELHGFGLDLPLRLGGVKGDAVETGALEVGGLRFGNVAVGGMRAALRVRRDAVELAQPVAVDLLGGTLQVSRFAAEEVTSPEMRVAFAMALQAVELEALTTALNLPPLRGSLSGAIPKITATGDQVRSEGEIRIQAFGGNIAVHNLRVDQLFSSVPTLGLDLDFEDLSLGQITEAFEVGRISGVAGGGARNLAIVNGQPLSFDAWLETVERPGVSQRISVSAIRQLSILGGSGSDPFSQGILGLFDEYRYAAMGFRCRLENDRFLLRGVETIDGKEYLVVGSFLPPRVNVVSHNQVISFSEMVQRLQRMTAASSAEGEGEQP